MAPPPQPPHEGPPTHHGPPPPGWAMSDGMKDEDVLRFAPPEIRRLWRRVTAIEAQLSEIKSALERIESLLRGRDGGT